FPLRRVPDHRRPRASLRPRVHSPLRARGGHRADGGAADRAHRRARGRARMTRFRGALGAAAIAGLCALYAWAFLRAESQRALALLVLAGVAAGAVATRTRLLDKLPPAPERLTQSFTLLAVVGLCLALHEDDFSLLLVARVLIVVLACLGLHIQLGYAGVLNFAGASFFGVGGYPDAAPTRSAGVPHPLVLPAGGAMAALRGTLIAAPVLRTRG